MTYMHITHDSLLGVPGRNCWLAVLEYLLRIHSTKKDFTQPVFTGHSSFVVRNPHKSLVLLCAYNCTLLQHFSCTATEFLPPKINRTYFCGPRGTATLDSDMSIFKKENQGVLVIGYTNHVSILGVNYLYQHSHYKSRLQANPSFSSCCSSTAKVYICLMTVAGLYWTVPVTSLHFLK